MAELGECLPEFVGNQLGEPERKQGINVVKKASGKVNVKDVFIF
jgi:hypothetical protein